MSKWLRAGNTLIDLSQFILFYAKEREQEEGEKELPESERWHINGRTVKGDFTLIGFTDSEKEAKEVLDAIHEALSTE